MTNANWAQKRFLQNSAKGGMTHFDISVAVKPPKNVFSKNI